MQVYQKARKLNDFASCFFAESFSRILYPPCCTCGVPRNPDILLLCYLWQWTTKPVLSVILSKLIWKLNEYAFHWCVVCFDRTIFGRDTTIWKSGFWGCKKKSKILIRFYSIQDYLYSDFHKTIAAKQLYRKLSFYNRFIYCRNLINLTYLFSGVWSSQII